MAAGYGDVIAMAKTVPVAKGAATQTGETLLALSHGGSVP